MATLACPNCRGAMEAIALRTAVKDVEIDACFACHVFWFDRMESPSLNDRSVLELFRRIHAHRDARRQPLGARAACPRCTAGLLKTQDIQRSNRIEYHRCASGCGRLTTFFQFLREKNFVRSLSPPEMQQLRAHVSQVRCSSCGAVVAIEKDAACRHCGAAVSILDADAAAKAVAHLSSRQAPAAAAAAATTATAAAAGTGRSQWVDRHNAHDGLHDMLTEAISDFTGLFSAGDGGLLD